ncbi:hypothetical protein JVT61DRAFT_14610 [Boletus reticuloceps]|uniref:Uncharacterized protein n=1 Tax=Boletus reticuloceps TaxID=495285 RepID=A0A8I2YSS1_9AGAM|nr:hypothetical protein JVT61DRAFT_14610 [Boletus reticuloceps]
MSRQLFLHHHFPALHLRFVVHARFRRSPTRDHYAALAAERESAPAPSGRRATDYRRVAADSLITVQVRENVLLADILVHVRVLDVL